MEKEEYIKKWLAGALTAEEQQAFEQSPDFTALKKLDKHLTVFKAPEFDILKGQSDLKGRFQSIEKQTKVVQLSPWKLSMRLAAAFIFLLVASYFLIDFIGTKEFNTQTAKNASVYLPDSSFVQLNAESKIAFNNLLWRYNRSLKLEGEAFFQVRKGEKFEVHSKDGKVAVLGTQFNVLQREDLFEVICYEGIVSVTYQNRKDTLTAGDRLRVFNESATFTQVTLTEKPGWTAQESVFESMSLQYVLDELARQYPIQLEISQIDTKTVFTGGFTHKNLEEALQTICEPLGLKYKIKDQVVTIESAN